MTTEKTTGKTTRKPRAATATRKPRKRTARAGSKPAAAPRITPAQRHAMIAELAYFRAESRGFQGGDPVEDWLIAEREVDARLAAQAGGTPQ